MWTQVLVPEPVDTDLLVTKMEMRERWRRQKGTLLSYWNSGTYWGTSAGDFRGSSIVHPFLSVVPERAPHACSRHVHAHLSSHTDTHTHGGNKYIRTKVPPA